MTKNKINNSTAQGLGMNERRVENMSYYNLIEIDILFDDGKSMHIYASLKKNNIKYTCLYIQQG